MGDKLELLPGRLCFDDGRGRITELGGLSEIKINTEIVVPKLHSVKGKIAFERCRMNGKWLWMNKVVNAKKRKVQIGKAVAMMNKRMRGAR